MSLKIGIIGLPNVGKSTTFNALVQEQNAQVANYPFCTIEPNIAVVPVPDTRLHRLADLVKVKNVIPAMIEFVDVAGLVKGASKGEGLGNKFLGNIRNVDAILHVIRCFKDSNVIHISEDLDPVSDIEIINTELALSDFNQIERKIEKLSRQVKGNIKLMPILTMAEKIKGYLSKGLPLWTFPEKNAEGFVELNQELQFLTAKPVLYLANVDENSIVKGNACFDEAEAFLAKKDSKIIKLCADLEQELISLDEAEKKEYLEMSGISHAGLDQIIREGYRMLDLISFFTFNEAEARAWTIKNGWTAPQAAGLIHTDFERGFIKAEVASFENFIQYGSWGALKNAGELRIEGRNYVVNDGDVILFRYNV